MASSARISARALALFVLCIAGAARADDTERATIGGIDVELRGCAGLEFAELTKLLAIEFRTLDVEREAERESISIACGGARARLRFEPSGASSDVELAGTAKGAWPRLLALAASELVMEARARVPEATQKVEDRTVTATVATPVVPKPTPVSWRVLGGARAQWVPNVPVMLWGPELGVAVSPLEAIALELRGHASFGGTETPLAHVGWTAMGGSVAVRWEIRARSFGFGIGPGFALDSLRLSPNVTIPAASGRAVSGPWGGPELDIQGRFSLTSALLVYARFDAGILALPVHGDASDGRRLVEASGGWVAAALGIGATL